MLRTIKLYGSLEKLTGKSEFVFNCDNQKQLLSGLKCVFPETKKYLREHRTLHMAWGESGDDKNLRPVEQDFQFSNKAKLIHLCAATEGAYFAIPYIIAAVVAVVVSYVITRLMMPSTSNNQQSSRSTMFNGPVNTTDQGNPIPIIYGKCVMVGSQIIATDEDYYNMLGTQISSIYTPDKWGTDYSGDLGAIGALL